MRVDFDIFGDEDVARDFLGLSMRAADMRPPLARVRDIVIAGQSKSFASRGSYLGYTWPALSPVTVARKGSSQPLQRTGALRASVMGGRGKRTSVSRARVRVGTNVWYAHFQHGGTKTGIPARRIGGISTLDRQRSLNIMRDYLVDGAL